MSPISRSPFRQAVPLVGIPTGPPPPVPGYVFPQTSIILDDFNRANGVMGPNWNTLGSTSLQIFTNRVTGQPAAQADNRWLGTSPTPNQEVYATVSIAPVDQSFNYMMIMARVNPTLAQYYYGFYQDLPAGNLWTLGGNGVGTLASNAAGPQLLATHKIGLSANGQELKLYHHNGTSWSTILSATDATYTSGTFGLGVYSNFPYWDDFGGGSLV